MHKRERLTNVKNSLQPITLLGEQCFSKEYGIRAISIIDTFLVIATVKESIFSVYSLNSYDFLGAFGKKGSGPKEFIAPSIMNNNNGNNSLSSLWILDRARNNFCLLDIKSSISHGDAIVVSKHQFPDTLNPVYMFFLNDSNFVGNTEESTVIFNYNPITNGTELSSIAFDYKNKRLSHNAKRDLFFNRISINPDKNRMVSIFCYFPRFDIYKLTNDKGKVNFSHHEAFITERMPRGITTDKVYEGKIFTYHEDIFVTNNYIYILSLNQIDREVGVVEKNVSIYLFDWDGMPAHHFSIKEYIRDFTVDEERGIIYGVNYERDEIFRYCFKQFIL